MHRRHLSISGLSIVFALLLALWEVYFFRFPGERLFESLDETFGWFTPDRLGFNMAWLVWAYLSYQLHLHPIRFADWWKPFHRGHRRHGIPSATRHCADRRIREAESSRYRTAVGSRDTSDLRFALSRRMFDVAATAASAST